MGLDICW